MLEQFVKFNSQHSLLSHEDKILAAVSGGPDSMALAFILHKLKYNFAIAHFNFKLRGKDSELDQKLVEDFAKQLEVQFFTTQADTKKFAAQHKLSIEQAARQLRYDWFNQLAQQHGFNKIATAHTADDTVETFLLNLARGTGIKGLTGIPLKNNNIVRPLLFAYKSQILSFCHQNNIPYRIDKTNLENDFNRNKIRNQIIPLFEQINPAFKQNVLRTIENLIEANNVLEAFVHEQEQQIVHKSADNLIYLDKRQLLSADFAHFVLHSILTKYNFSPDQIRQIYHSLDKSIPGKKFFSRTHQLIFDRNNIIISPWSEKKIEKNFHLIYSHTKHLDLNDIVLNFNMIDNQGVNLKVPPTVALIDYHKISFPLILRNWQYGDWFIPLGMKGKKKLSDFLINKKINLLEKQKILVLTDKYNQIIWVVGLRLDERFKVSPKTKKILKITISQK